jgi:uncharacterized protein
MELTNDFRVAVPPARAWEVLTDVERIAPCMPGAQLQEIEGDEYRGIVKVKVGPITAQYKGKATFVERDQDGGRLVLRAEGRETRGQGNANATITATLSPDGDGTAVSVVTDLTVTGRVAQFGRGVLADVSSKLLGQFVDCLESTVLTDDAPAAAPAAPSAPEPAPASAPATPSAPEPAPASAPAAPSAPEPAPGADRPEPAPTAPSAPSGSAVRRVDSPEPTPVDLFDAAGSSMAKRVAPIAAVLIVLWLLRRLARRRG